MSLYMQKAQACATVIPHASEKLQTAAEDVNSGTKGLIRVPNMAALLNAYCYSSKFKLI